MANEMTGLFSQLSDEQQAQALAYRGPENHGITVREIGIKFYRLTFNQKVKIVNALGLSEPDDNGKSDFERFKNVLLRASEQNKLAELCREIEEVK